METENLLKFTINWITQLGNYPKLNSLHKQQQTNWIMLNLKPNMNFLLCEVCRTFSSMIDRFAEKWDGIEEYGNPWFGVDLEIYSHKILQLIIWGKTTWGAIGSGRELLIRNSFTFNVLIIIWTNTIDITLRVAILRGSMTRD